MGKTAARMTDAHICPMINPGPLPHVGGPVMPVCEPTVLIGALPAARKGDNAMCTPVATPDAIATGIPTIKIGGLDAAITCSMTMHGGMISSGCPTVMLAPSSFVSQASASSQPTAAEIQQVQTALDTGRFQDAIDLTILHYGIDVSNVPNAVDWNAAEGNYGVTSIAGDIDIGPAGAASPELLASTITHETTHANQAAAQRAANPGIAGWDGAAESVNYDEAMAYDSEIESVNNTGLDQDPVELEVSVRRRGTHFDALSDAGKINFCGGGYP